jgi:hypothetical protein
MTKQIESLEATRLGGFGHSSSEDAPSAGRDSVQMALAGAEPQLGDLVIIFPSATYDLDSLHRGAMDAAGPAEVVGCTTVGAFTSEEQVPSGCVAAYISSRDISFGVRHVERDDADIAGCTRAAAQEARDRAGDRYPHDVLMLMCDALTPDQRELARGAFAVTSSVISMVGGSAGDDMRFEATYTFGEGRMLSNGILTVWLNSAQTMGVSVGRGWRPFGKPMLVTRAEGTTILELDGQPALDAYLAARGMALNPDGVSFGESAMERPLGIPNARGRYDMRQIHDKLPNGGLVLTTGVPEQTVVQVMCSDTDALLEGSRTGAELGEAQLDRDARMAIVFSCCARRALLGDRVAEEVDTIASALGGVPTGGFYTCGEFGRVTGSTGIHNSCVALLML